MEMFAVPCPSKCDLWVFSLLSLVVEILTQTLPSPFIAIAIINLSWLFAHRSCLCPYPPSFLTLHLGAACVSFLATSSALTYWFLYPCHACERICCHLCIPAIIFWRFSPSQWKTECVWKLREISVMLPVWQLWLTGCIFFRAIYMSHFFLIGFEGYYIQEKYHH